MRSSVCFACFYMRPKCVIPITWCTWHQVLCGCACTRVYVHTQSNWISYEIRFKVSTTYAHPSYLLLIASDILLRKSVWYIRSTWRRRTWILESSLIWVAVWSMIGWWQMSPSSLTPASGLSETRHYSWDTIPPIPWPMTLSPMTEAIRVKSYEKKPLVLGENLPAWWLGTI